MMPPRHYHGPNERTRSQSALIRSRALRHHQVLFHDQSRTRPPAANSDSQSPRSRRSATASARSLGGPTADPATRGTNEPPENPYPDLAPTGRAPWAWAKEHGRVDGLAAIGQAKRFPARIVDWLPHQVLTAAALHAQATAADARTANRARTTTSTSR